MIQLGEGLRFTLEPRQAFGIGRELRGQRLGRATLCRRGD
jgi:hypothetical protein